MTQLYVFIYTLILLYFIYIIFYKDTNNFKKARSILDRKSTITLENIPLEDNIPKNILQIYEQKELIPDFIINNVKDKNEEWKYNFFNNEESLNYLKEEYGEEFVKKYNSFNKQKHKEDLFKLCWLYKNGGVYIDIFIQIILPLDEVIENVKNDFAVMQNIYKHDIYDQYVPDDQKPESLINSLIITNKGNPKIKKCIENIMRIDQTDLTENYSLSLFVMHNSLIDSESYQFFGKSENPFFPFLNKDYEIFDIKDRKIGNSNYKKNKDGIFIL